MLPGKAVWDHEGDSRVLISTVGVVVASLGVQIFVGEVALSGGNWPGLPAFGLPISLQGAPERRGEGGLRGHTVRPGVD